MVAAGLAAIYRAGPNTQVKWGHALTGGIFAAAGIELAKKLLTIYIGMVPTYSVVYGAFATVPILLVWIYVAWVIVLLGAVTAAYMPSLLAGVERRVMAYGWQFQLALEVLQQLHRVRAAPTKGLTLTQLAALLRVDPLHLEPVLETLTALDWAGQITEAQAAQEARYIMLANPDSRLLAPLLHTLLLQRDASTQNLWDKARLSSMTLRDVLLN